VELYGRRWAATTTRSVSITVAGRGRPKTLTDRGVKGRTSNRRGTSWERVCARALELPGVEQGTSYGTPSLMVRRRFLARLKEDGETVAIRVDFADRDVLLELDPAAFYLTDHYRDYPAMLVRLKQVRPEMLDRLIEDAWRRQAPKSLLRSRAEPSVGAVAPPRRSARRRGDAR
jgi:hypothetical protein